MFSSLHTPRMASYAHDTHNDYTLPDFNEIMLIKLLHFTIILRLSWIESQN